MRPILNYNDHMYAHCLHLSGLILFLSGMFFSSSSAAEIKTGDAAPGFELIDQYRQPHRLADYRGKWLVLYFYPKDDTPGCTTEACQFRDDIYRIRELQAEVIGVSVDNTESHAKFAEKHGLPFPLLSDGDGTVAQSYGALFGLGPIKLAKRHTFIVNPEGRIAKIYREVNPADHSAEIIRDLETLQQSGDSIPI